MCSWRRAVVAVSWCAAALAAAAQVPMPAATLVQPFAGIGRDASAAELAAWDIDVRADFTGLPAGSGSVAQGMLLWEAKCASCHGVFGESNQVFSPIVGGTTTSDMRTGRVARLTDSAYPQRTTLMKLSTLSTLWDYIYRAMPWQQPKSLSHDDVYAATAYILNLGGIVPDDFVLSNQNIRAVQAVLPNRNGKTTDHGLWPGRSLGKGGRADVRGSSCTSRCGPAPRILSALPAHARDAHGNLAEQNRLVGAQRGVQTMRATLATPPAAVDALALALAQQHGCTVCHALDSPLLGPSFKAIAVKHGERSDVGPYLAGKIKAGGQGEWGAVAMPPQAVSDSDAAELAQWLVSLSGKAR